MPDPTPAESLLLRLVLLNRERPDWWKESERQAEMAEAWGAASLRPHGVLPYEAEEVARLADDCHAAILIARTDKGLYASGYLARWGEGMTALEPGILSVPYDSEPQARKAALRDLIGAFSVGRRSKPRDELLEAVRERQRHAGLFG